MRANDQDIDQEAADDPSEIAASSGNQNHSQTGRRIDVRI